MVTGAECFDTQQAQQLQMALQAANIPSFIPDEFTAQNAPWYFVGSPAGVRLQVAEEHAAAARQIIAMDYPKEHSKSVYDYSDKSVQHAGYAAIAYAAISFFSGLLAWVQYFLYHRPGKSGSVLPDDFAAQQYLQHTPLTTAVAVASSVTLAAISGVLAFFIFRRSRFAIIAMVVIVMLLQLSTWFIAHSASGTLVSIVVVAFLLRGARRMFQDYAEQKLEAGKA